MLEILMQGRRHWPRQESDMHRTLRHLVEFNGRK
jgi:hypothetical protein